MCAPVAGCCSNDTVKVLQLTTSHSAVLPAEVDFHCVYDMIGVGEAKSEWVLRTFASKYLPVIQKFSEDLPMTHDPQDEAMKNNGI